MIGAERCATLIEIATCAIDRLVALYKIVLKRGIAGAKETTTAAPVALITIERLVVGDDVVGDVVLIGGKVGDDVL